MKHTSVVILFSLISYIGLAQCSASFSITNNSNGNVTFSNTSIGSPNSTYQWFFGDGSQNVVIGTSQQTHAYYNGVHVATLKLHDSLSTCTSSVSITFTVNNAPCNGAISDITIGQQQNGNCSFSPVMSGIDYNSSYSWVFSDGFNSTGFNVYHTFTNSGMYTTTLTATDQLGICNYTFVKSFSVTVAPCALTSLFTYTMGANGSVTFQSVSTGTSPTTSYYWNFGDGYSGYYNSPFSHTYFNSGSYNVSLQLHDSVNFTCTSSSTQLINYSACVNQLSFSMQKDSSQLPAIVYNAYAIYSQNTSSVTWDWGDGTVTTGNLSPSHTYSSTGTFSICVSTTVSCGTTNSACLNSTIFKTADVQQGPATVHVIPNFVTSIQTIETLSNLRTFPNPMMDELTIEATTVDNNKLNYVLIDALGRTVLTGDLNSSKEVVNTSNVEQGFYSLRIANEKGNTLQTIKLVK